MCSPQDGPLDERRDPGGGREAQVGDITPEARSFARRLLKSATRADKSAAVEFDWWPHRSAMIPDASGTLSVRGAVNAPFVVSVTGFTRFA